MKNNLLRHLPKLAPVGVACVMIAITMSWQSSPQVDQPASKQVVSSKDSTQSVQNPAVDTMSNSKDTETSKAPRIANVQGPITAPNEQSQPSESAIESSPKKNGAFSIAIRDVDSIPADPLVALGLDLEPRNPHPVMPLYLPPGDELIIRFKFMDSAMARLSEDNQLQVSNASEADVNQLIEVAHKYSLEIVPTYPMAEGVDNLRIKAARRSGRMQPDLNGTMEISLQEPTLALEIAQAMQSIKLIEHVEISSPEFSIAPAADIAPTTPNLEFEQDYLLTSPGLGANYLKALGADGSGVRFTVLDHGVNPNHEDLNFTVAGAAADSPNILSGLNPTHGTATLGVTNAGDNGYGMTGIAPEADAYFYSTRREFPSNNFLVAFNQAVNASNEGDVITMALGIILSGVAAVPLDYNTSYWNAIRVATDLGVIVVMAAGNGDQDLDDPFFDAYNNRGDSGAIIVGASTANVNRNKMGFSTYGSRVDVHAWGEQVASTGYGLYAQYGNDPNQNYTISYSGTSSASSLVGGAATLLQSFAKNQLGITLSPEEMRDYLKNNGHPQGNGGDIGLGVALDLAVEALIADSSNFLLGQDIGNVAADGSNLLDNTGQYTVEASGADIWGTSDEFRFVNKVLRGNGEIIANVTSLQNTHPWAKAGIMIRESLDADSANAAVLVTPSNGVRFQNRGVTGGTTLGTTGSSAQTSWLRLVRENETFLTAYESADGTNWTQIGIATIPMSTEVHIGLAVTSHNDGVLTTATFDNVTVIQYEQDTVDQLINPGNAASFAESHPNDPLKINGVGNGTIGYIQPNTWFAFTDFEFANASTPTPIWVDLEISKGSTTNANLEIRLDSPTGTLLTTIPVTNTGGWTTFESFSAPLNTVPTNTFGQVYFVFTGDPGYLMDVKSVRFRSDEIDRLIEAEDFDSESNPSMGNPISVLGIPGGGSKVGFITNNSWIKFEDVAFGGYTSLSAPGGTGIELTYSSTNTASPDVELRLDSPTGPLLTTLNIDSTGNWNNFATLQRQFDGGQVITGTQDLYLVFKGTGFLMDVDSFIIRESIGVGAATLSASATSEEPGFPASNAVDGDINTIWDIATGNFLSQSITLDLGGVYPVSGLTYVPRQDGNTLGIIRNHNIYTSTDGIIFTLVASGNWAGDTSTKTTTFNTTSATHVRLEATGAVGNDATAAEITLY